ncbi:unnamed protein product [Heligmosomoides polygyrus]|uniref:Tub domain-containing protein n=1 Tax=Heligmosomoides polygyrus TaxID=6339 RepID=A0A183GRE4_HELPZ|nr:unnamed protein product [Heligmosomoides polygyrus]
MDSLLLLCWVDAFFARGSGMFMHSVRGCVCACADCNCVGPAKSLHSVDWEYIQEDQVRRHGTDRDENTPPPTRPCDSGEELFLGTCDSSGIGGVGVLVKTHLAMNIDSYESLTTRIGRLRLKRCGSTQAFTAFTAYAPIPDYDDDEADAFCVELEKF